MILMKRNKFSQILLYTLSALLFFGINHTAEAYSPVEVAELARPATVGVYAAVRGDKYYGTGVIITPEGTILTSTSVVPAEADSIQIYFEDHTSLRGEILDYSEETQSVILKVHLTAPRKFPFLPLQQQLPELAEPVFTLGNASNMIKLGDGVSFSAGVVSGIYPIPLKSRQGIPGNDLTVIETDAAVNDGQDGGGLINTEAEVIGIISRDFSTLRWQGTAIPSGAIISGMKYFTAKENNTVIHNSNTEHHQNKLKDITDEIRQSLVSITVERLYPPEELQFPEWNDYRSQITGWESFSQTEQRRIIVDFFSAESLTAANRMLRRPEQPVTGLLISADGYIITSSFNVESTDTAFIDSSTRQLRATPYTGSIEEMLQNSQADTQKVNNRVINIRVRLSSGEELPAAIVGFSTPLGLALLKVNISAYPKYYRLKENTASPTLGEEVAILGLYNDSYTVNTGIISAPSRNRGNYFQFDALLNYGNSGGPIINSAGKLLGLGARPLTPSPVSGSILPFSKSDPVTPLSLTLQDFTCTPNSGIGMGIKTDKIIKTLPKLLNGEGINSSEVITLGLLPARNDPYSSEIVVGRVVNNSPAARAGFKTGDIIRKMDGMGIRSWSEVNSYIAQKTEDQVVIFSITRPLEKPYIQLNGEKINTAADLYDFIRNNPDGTKISGHVSSPGINQKLYVTLSK